MLASTVAYGRIALICGALAESWTVPLVRTRAASSHLEPSVARAIGRARKPGSRGRVIARPGSCAGRYSGCRACRAVPLSRRDRDLVGGQRHLCRGSVLLQPVVPSGARDRHDPWVLGQQPCRRELSRRSALHLGELGVLDQRLVGGPVLGGEPGDGRVDIAFGELSGGVHGAGEEAPC